MEPLDKMLATILAFSLILRLEDAAVVVTSPNNGMLDRSGVIQYVGQNAGQYGLDPAAVLAVANGEGLNTKPGGTWNLQGESGYNFGPPSWYTGGAGNAIVKMQGANAPAWSWTPAGLDYWLQQVRNAIGGGLTGSSAIQAIVHKFERPREDLRPGAIQKAISQYSGFQQAIQGPVSTPGNIPTTTPTDTQTPIDTGVTGTMGVGGAPRETSGLDLNLGDSLRHLSFQFLLVLVGLALLVGGVYLLGSRS